MLKTSPTRIRYGGLGSLQATAQHSTSNTGGPLGIHGGVPHGGDIVSVEHNRVALGCVILQIESSDIGVVDVGRIGDIHDQRGGTSGVGGVTSKERGPVIESQTDKGILTRDRRERRPVGNAEQAPFVGCNKRSAVGPVTGGVCTRVNREDDINVALRLDQRVERNVLKVFAAVYNGEALGLSALGCGVVITVERIWAVVRDIIVGIAEVFENLGNERLGRIGNVNGRVIGIEQELIKERGRCAHDIAGIIKPTDTTFTVG